MTAHRKQPLDDGRVIFGEAVGDYKYQTNQVPTDVRREHEATQHHSFKGIPPNTHRKRSAAL